MRLVIDSNVLFTYFWARSVARKLLLWQELEACAPEYAFGEILRHGGEIRRKARLSPPQFTDELHDLRGLVEAVPLRAYARVLKEAARISPDPDDADFFALALARRCPIWSNDRALAGQSNVEILTTADVILLVAAQEAEKRGSS